MTDHPWARDKKQIRTRQNAMLRCFTRVVELCQRGNSFEEELRCDREMICYTYDLSKHVKRSKLDQSRPSPTRGWYLRTSQPKSFHPSGASQISIYHAYAVETWWLMRRNAAVRPLTALKQNHGVEQMAEGRQHPKVHVHEHRAAAGTCAHLSPRRNYGGYEYNVYLVARGMR